MSERRIFSRLEPSCHWPDDKELATLILGPKRAHLWPALVKAEEKAGFPRVSLLYGGREWAAIVEFYERRRRNAAPPVTTLADIDDERSKETWGYTKRLVEKKAERAANKAAREAAAGAKQPKA